MELVFVDIEFKFILFEFYMSVFIYYVKFIF